MRPTIVGLAICTRRDDSRLIYMNVQNLRSSYRDVVAKRKDKVLSGLDLTFLDAFTIQRALQLGQHRRRTVIRMPRDSNRRAAEALDLIMTMLGLYIDQGSRIHVFNIYRVKRFTRCHHKGSEELSSTYVAIVANRVMSGIVRTILSF